MDVFKSCSVCLPSQFSSIIGAMYWTLSDLAALFHAFVQLFVLLSLALFISGFIIDIRVDLVIKVPIYQDDFLCKLINLIQINLLNGANMIY